MTDSSIIIFAGCLISPESVRLLDQAAGHYDHIKQLSLIADLSYSVNCSDIGALTRSRNGTVDREVLLKDSWWSVWALVQRHMKQKACLCMFDENPSCSD